MKICVLNSSGNVGKTTVVREVLYPRLQKCQVVEIESYNSSNSKFNINTIKFEGDEDFEKLYEYLLSEDDIIFDVGASEIANFFENLSEYSGAIQMFDFFVIPSIADSKMMEDTAKTILFLRSQDIEDEKIKVIFNQVSKKVENEFSALLNFDFDFDTEIFIKKSNFFKDLAILKKTFVEVYNPNKRHYKDLMQETNDALEKRKLIKQDLLNMGAEKKIKELDFIFTKITGIDCDTLSTLSFSSAKKGVEKKKVAKKVIKDENMEDENDEEL